MEAMIRNAASRTLSRPPHGKFYPATASRHRALHGSSRLLLMTRRRIATPGGQAIPHQGFYAEVLKNPSPNPSPQTHPQLPSAPTRRTPLAASPASEPTRDPTSSEAESDSASPPRIVFGSRLAGPAQRRAARLASSKDIAGVLVPPRPAEPDNCCMSGCVNCVWDAYREDLEEWAAKNAEAKARLSRADKKGVGSGKGDKGMSARLQANGDGGEDDLFKDIPVGIREFMKTEKMLQQKHLKEERPEG